MRIHEAFSKKRLTNKWVLDVIWSPKFMYTFGMSYEHCQYQKEKVKKKCQ
uniref:Uncharacterized protein n=1 Tax=Rhizophora mucronata TaxID=61149 RepID=A0A2P2KZR6_RHIMU